MGAPSTTDVMREEAKRAERYRILLLASECKTLEELIQRLKAEEEQD